MDTYRENYPLLSTSAHVCLETGLFKRFSFPSFSSLLSQSHNTIPCKEARGPPPPHLLPPLLHPFSHLPLSRRFLSLLGWAEDDDDDAVPRLGMRRTHRPQLLKPFKYPWRQRGTSPSLLVCLCVRNKCPFSISSSSFPFLRVDPPTLVGIYSARDTAASTELVDMGGSGSTAKETIQALPSMHVYPPPILKVEAVVGETKNLAINSDYPSCDPCLQKVSSSLLRSYRPSLVGPTFVPLMCMIARDIEASM